VPKDPNIENRIVAFLDILGMRQHLSNPTSEDAFINNICTIIGESLKPKIALSVALPHVRESRAVEVGFSGWREEVDCRITSISDSLVASMPLLTKMGRKNKSQAWSIYQCLSVVFWLQRALIQVGVLTRGAVCIGKIYHANSIIVGSGLVAAYELETDVAIYPRVVLGESITEVLVNEPMPENKFFFRQRLGNLFAKDRDGMYFVDYLGLDVEGVEVDWKERLLHIQNFVATELGTLRNIRAKQKLLWLQEYVRAALLVDHNDNTPHRTSGRLESLYPRHFPDEVT
jgi:hypothetical protein